MNEKTERMFDMAKPKSSGEMLKLIGNELTLLWVQMDAYQTIFLLEREKRRRLMEETAPGFFSVVQFTLFESLLLRLGGLKNQVQHGMNDQAFPWPWLLPGSASRGFFVVAH